MSRQTGDPAGSGRPDACNGDAMNESYIKPPANLSTSSAGSLPRVHRKDNASSIRSTVHPHAQTRWSGQRRSSRLHLPTGPTTPGVTQRQRTSERTWIRGRRQAEATARKLARGLRAACTGPRSNWLHIAWILICMQDRLRPREQADRILYINA